MTNPTCGYRLIRVDDVEIFVVGDYVSYDAAMVARDDDVITVLAASGGWYRVITHWILPKGMTSHEAVATVACAVGVDPTRPAPPSQADLDDTRRWLANVHRSAN